MESFNTKNANILKESRFKNFFVSLAAMRTEEFVDVTIVCGDKEFGAHKLVLEASSPYFVAMFRSGMEEANSGKIVFKSVEADIMEVVLKYIYEGEVHMINTQEQAVKVLAAAHMMELNELSKYCMEALCNLISEENCVELWEISTIYEDQTLTTKILGFVLEVFQHVKARTSFLKLSDEKLKQFLGFAAGNEDCLCEILRYTLSWLRYDLEDREKFVGDLFAYFEPKLFKSYCIKSLLRQKGVVTVSPVIANKMNELGVAVLILPDERTNRNTLQLVVHNLSKINVKRCCPQLIQNLTWNIEIRRRTETGKRGTIGFYVACNHGSKNRNWSCTAVVQYGMVSHGKLFLEITPDIVFSSEGSRRGYREFIDLDRETAPWFSYISDDTAIFAAKIVIMQNQQYMDG